MTAAQPVIDLTLSQTVLAVLLFGLLTVFYTFIYITTSPTRSGLR